MKKKKEEPIAEIQPTTPLLDPELGLNPGIVWVGSDAMRRITEKAEEAYYGYFSENPDDEPHPGLRQIEEFLGELQSVSGLRLRLIFGSPDKPLHELDISKLPINQGGFETDVIKDWVAAGAALIADASEKSS